MGIAGPGISRGTDKGGVGRTTGADSYTASGSSLGCSRSKGSSGGVDPVDRYRSRQGGQAADQGSSPRRNGAMQANRPCERGGSVRDQWDLGASRMPIGGITVIALCRSCTRNKGGGRGSDEARRCLGAGVLWGRRVRESKFATGGYSALSREMRRGFPWNSQKAPRRQTREARKAGSWA